VDFARLENCRAVKLFISAFNVKTGKIRIFKSGEITPDVLLASACLPFLFQAVTIDGRLLGNPAIFPLIYGSDTSDVVIIQINPLGCDRVPTTATEIMNRLNEISFNSSLMREMRAISFVTDLIDQGKLHSNQYRRINVHCCTSMIVVLHNDGQERSDDNWQHSCFARTPCFTFPSATDTLYLPSCRPA